MTFTPAEQARIDGFPVAHALTDKQKREIVRLPIGAHVRMRGAPGLGTGRITKLEAPRGDRVDVRVAWPGLDEGRSYTYEQWETSRDLYVVSDIGCR